MTWKSEARSAASALRFPLGDEWRVEELGPAERAQPRPRCQAAGSAGDFEGVIPEGEYGAGTVIVWDAGTFRNITQHNGRPVPLEQGLRDGHIAVWLNGKKLKGGFALTRLRRGKQETWLLVKMQDAEAAPGLDLTKTQPRSVRTGRTLEEVARMARRPARRRE